MKLSGLRLLYENIWDILIVSILIIIAIFLYNKYVNNISFKEKDIQDISYLSNIDLVSSRVGFIFIMIFVILYGIIYYFLH